MDCLASDLYARSRDECKNYLLFDRVRGEPGAAGRGWCFPGKRAERRLNLRL